MRAALQLTEIRVWIPHCCLLRCSRLVHTLYLLKVALLVRFAKWWFKWWFGGWHMYWLCWKGRIILVDSRRYWILCVSVWTSAVSWTEHMGYAIFAYRARSKGTYLSASIRLVSLKIFWLKVVGCFRTCACSRQKTGLALLHTLYQG